ncbi:hypothetical protein B0H13DRAFT_2274141 [Mycena leptocephala]|nr:hypothetical protein B0H13DRAFT_2274141 [Mycena leptocephala]
MYRYRQSGRGTARRSPAVEAVALFDGRKAGVWLRADKLREQVLRRNGGTLDAVEGVQAFDVDESNAQLPKRLALETIPDVTRIQVAAYDYGSEVERGRGKGASVGVVVDNISNIRLKLSDQRMWLQLKHACGPDWFDNTNGDIRAGCAAVWLAARTNAGLQVWPQGVRLNSYKLLKAGTVTYRGPNIYKPAVPINPSHHDPPYKPSLAMYLVQ